MKMTRQTAADLAEVVSALGDQRRLKRATAQVANAVSVRPKPSPSRPTRSSIRSGRT
jgi:hypothetical protein